jgi:hypothetical protein
MPIFNSIASWWMRKRMHQIELFMKYPHDVQNEWLKKNILSAEHTEWGRKYKFSSIKSVDDFRKQVPLQDYDSLKPYIDRMRRGEQNVLWPGETKWFSKSSGTTSDKSKYIPLSMDSLEGCHYNGGRDMVAIYCNNYEDTKLFTGKNLSLAGNFVTDNFNEHESYSGDLSAIVINNLPLWAEFLRAPDLSIALLSDWDEKMEKVARAVMNENMTSIAGVPSWMMVLMRHIIKISGKKSMSEVWPNFEVFFHGGVNFNPYKEIYKGIFGADKIRFLELYNASEGFFGIQENSAADDLLLMLDYGIHYEFIPMEEWNNDFPKTISLADVELNKNYALVISTTSGLWRYKIGDTVKFTSINPYRVKISGRTKHFINVFGEEIIIDNADNAIRIACEKTGALVTEYTAGPVYMKENENGTHEWLIEFEKHPDNLDYFAEMLDNALKSLNSDYEAKRYHNFTLKPPLVKAVKQGAFVDWLRSKGKLGGQNKVPRLSNDRKIIEEIKKYA